jgi:hypothetical protein
MKVKLSEDNIKIFKDCLRMINIHSTDITFITDKDKMSILFMDPTQSMFFRIEFNNKFFDEYECKDERISLSSTFLISSLSYFKDEVTLESSESLLIVKSKSKKYELGVIGDNMGVTHEPHLDNDDATIISIEADELRSISKEVEEIADIFTFVKTKDKIQVSGNDMNIKGFTADLDCTITKDMHENFRAKYGMTFLGKVTPFLSGTLFLKIKTPLARLRVTLPLKS